MYVTRSVASITVGVGTAGRIGTVRASQLQKAFLGGRELGIND